MTTQTTPDVYENFDIRIIDERLDSLFKAISCSSNKDCRNRAHKILSSTKEIELYEKHKKNNK